MLEDLAISLRQLETWPALAAISVLSLSLAVLMVRGGLAYYSRTGKNNGLLTAILAAGTAGLFAAGAFYGAQYVKGVVDAAVRDIPPAITKDWNRNAAPSQRRDDSTTVARSIFVTSGRITYRLSESGDLTLFVPDERDYAARDVWLDDIANIRAAVALLRAVAWLWLLLPIGAAIAIAALKPDRDHCE